MTDQGKTPRNAEKFDHDPFSEEDRLVHDRCGPERRKGGKGSAASRADQPAQVPPERRAKKERRRRIDPTTFEKQYTDDEIEFMNAMQRFKIQSGQAFPTYGEVLKVAAGLGYRKQASTPGDTADSTATLK